MAGTTAAVEKKALLEIAAVAKSDQSHEDLLPTRLHYFVRAQDGLHICVHRACPETTRRQARVLRLSKGKSERSRGRMPRLL